MIYRYNKYSIKCLYLDKGEDIYKASIADIENAIQLIDGKKGDVPASADIVFKGSMAKWKAFANSKDFPAFLYILWQHISRILRMF